MKPLTFYMDIFGRRKIFFVKQKHFVSFSSYFSNPFSWSREDVIKVTVDSSTVKGASDPIITYGKKSSTSVA